METTQYIQLPDGTYAALSRSMSYGDVTIILLLVAIVVMQAYTLWVGMGRARPQTIHVDRPAKDRRPTEEPSK